MNVAELFATLGIKPNEAEWARAKAKIDDFDKKTTSKFQRLKKNIGTGFGINIASGITNAARRVGGAMVDAGRDALNFNEQLTRLDIASKGSMGSMDQVQKQIFKVSKATGVAKEELLKGTAQFIALTGEGKAASESMKTFARVAVASGASMDDITTSAAALMQNMQIDPKDFEKAFSILIAGGKAGAIELKDVAGLMSEIAPLSERFAGGGGLGGLANLNAALQLTRRGAGSASQAATQLSSLMSAIVKNAAKLEKAKIQVFTKDENGVKRMRSFSAIMKDLGESKLAKDPTLLIDALGRKEAEAATIQLTKNRDAWDELAAGTMDANDVAEDYDKFQKSSAAKVKKAWNNVKVAVAEAFTPERVEAMSKALETALGFASDLVGAIEDVAHFVDVLRGDDDPVAVAGGARSTVIREGRKAGLSPREIVEQGLAGEEARDEMVLRDSGVPEGIIDTLRAMRNLEGNDGGALGFRPGSTLDDLSGGLGGGNQPLVPEFNIVPEAPRQLSGISGLAPTLNLELEIHAGNADAYKTVEIAKREITKFWDTKMRELGL
jgi:TP901 family phage tail tape measure protein